MEKTDKEYNCFVCSCPLTEDNFCFGCRAAICDDCDRNPGLTGDHYPEDHVEEDER